MGSLFGGRDNSMQLYNQQQKDMAAQRATDKAEWDREKIANRADAVAQRKADDERSDKLAARTMKEEKARIKNLAEAEGSAVEESEEIMGDLSSDRDSQFGEMFASLLRGAQQGFSRGNKNKGVTRNTGLRAPKKIIGGRQY